MELLQRNPFVQLIYANKTLSITSRELFKWYPEYCWKLYLLQSLLFYVCQLTSSLHMRISFKFCVKGKKPYAKHCTAISLVPLRILLAPCCEYLDLSPIHVRSFRSPMPIPAFLNMSPNIVQLCLLNLYSKRVFKTYTDLY
jgi:hypothetical protein